MATVNVTSPLGGISWKDGAVTDSEDGFLVGRLDALTGTIAPYPEACEVPVSEFRSDPYVFIEACKAALLDPAFETVGLPEIPEGAPEPPS